MVTGKHQSIDLVNPGTPTNLLWVSGLMLLFLLLSFRIQLFSFFYSKISDSLSVPDFLFISIYPISDKKEYRRIFLIQPIFSDSILKTL